MLNGGANYVGGFVKKNLTLTQDPHQKIHIYSLFLSKRERERENLHI